MAKILRQKSLGYKGDYLENWERNLLKLNPSMQKDAYITKIITDNWYRMNNIDDIKDDILYMYIPDQIKIVISEFYVLPKCANNDCDATSNLWLNIYDGYIGCGRKLWFNTKYGGNGCALTHFNEMYKNNNNNHKYTGLVVKLGTIKQDYADLWDYKKDMFPNIPLNELKELLMKWGIKMGLMFQYDRTTKDIDTELFEMFRTNKNKRNH